MNNKVASQVTKRLKTWDLGKLENFKKIPEVPETDKKVLTLLPKIQFLTVVLQNCKNSAVEHFVKKLMLPNFEYWTIISCPNVDWMNIFSSLVCPDSKEFVHSMFFSIINSSNLYLGQVSC